MKWLSLAFLVAGVHALQIHIQPKKPKKSAQNKIGAGVKKGLGFSKKKQSQMTAKEKAYAVQNNGAEGFCFIPPPSFVAQWAKNPTNKKKNKKKK